SCQVCCGVILGIFQAWHKCKTCNYCCHKKCLSDITRTCTTAKISENPCFTMNICPEQGLHQQNYRCYECKAAIGFQPSTNEARQCDYDGLFYCNKCHWNDSMAIPARIVYNWDFDLKKVCRASKSFLRMMSNRPVINIQTINPMLFTYLEELNEVKNRRIEILMMKKFFVECPRARKEKLLTKLQHRPHFVDGSDVYSVNDLLDLTNDILLPEITRIHASYVQHIKYECETCQQKGQRCMICRHESGGDLLFPFDCTATVCPKCSCLMHLHCYQMKNQICPNCSS
ncbi:hypothetical protein HELRODRAFT_69510, partial [Helobdella robusta]|uniref:Phorbol-ester/DAG-type domain-containing protein n=1 Tax=Helobdella robusta TaxID=6412 RepID=T1FZW2_HELRO